jgi:hypothetical protein
MFDFRLEVGDCSFELLMMLLRTLKEPMHHARNRPKNANGTLYQCRRR